MCALQSGRPLPEYPCGQQDLYTIVETGWQSYAEYLADFMTLSTLYTASTGTDQLSALGAARKMPDEDSRTEVHKTLRIQLADMSEKCLILWSDMNTYIRDGFPANEYESKRIAAGHNYYAGASHENWDDVKGLMQNGVDFASLNSAVLTSGGMPATFVTDLDDAKTQFEAKHQEFLHAEEDSKVLTDQKINANNELYRALIKMFEDGKRIFRNNAAVREQFTFDSIWELVSGGGSGTTSPTTVSITGNVSDTDTTAPVNNASVVFSSPAIPGAILANTDSNGNYSMSITGLTAGATISGNFEVSATSYNLASNPVDVTAGKNYTFDFTLTPEAP